MKNKNLYLLSVLTGVLLALSYPPYPFSWFAFIAFVPLLFAIEQKPQRTFLLFYIPFFIYHCGTNWWISSWQKESDPFLIISGLLFCLIHPFFFMIPMIIYHNFRKRKKEIIALFSFPFIWVTFEWAHSLGDLSFPWLNIGYTQIYNLDWIQFIDITGIYGSTFLIIFCNIIILLMVQNIRSYGRCTLKNFFASRQNMNYLVVILSIIIIPTIYGFIKSNNYEHKKLLKENSVVNIGLIQPNINPWKKWETNVLRQVALHQEIQDSLMRVHILELCVWSETSVHYINSEVNTEHNFSFLTNWLELKGVSLLTGFADMQKFPATAKGEATSKYYPGDSSFKYNSYNSSLLLTPNLKNNPEHQIYHKMKLTPFSERLPYPEILSYLFSWVEWGVGISSWTKGDNQHTLDIVRENDSVKIGTIICIESIYPGFVRKFAKLGANIYVIITNDGWYDYTFGPEQHYLIAQARAIESRRYIARCANTGITGFIQPNGNTLMQAEQYKSVGIASSIPLLEEQTIYVKYGDWFAYLSVVITIYAMMYIVIKKKLGY